MADSMETLVIDFIKRFDDTFIQQAVRHQLTFIDQVHQTVSRYVVETILADKKIFEYINLAAAVIDFSETIRCGQMSAADPHIGGVSSGAMPVHPSGVIAVAGNDRGNYIICELAVRHRPPGAN